MHTAAVVPRIVQRFSSRLSVQGTGELAWHDTRITSGLCCMVSVGLLLLPLLLLLQSLDRLHKTEVKSSVTILSPYEWSVRNSDNCQKQQLTVAAVGSLQQKSTAITAAIYNGSNPRPRQQPVTEPTQRTTADKMRQTADTQTTDRPMNERQIAAAVRNRRTYGIPRSLQRVRRQYNAY